MMEMVGINLRILGHSNVVNKLYLNLTCFEWKFQVAVKNFLHVKSIDNKMGLVDIIRKRGPNCREIQYNSQGPSTECLMSSSEGHNSHNSAIHKSHQLNTWLVHGSRASNRQSLSGVQEIWSQSTGLKLERMWRPRQGGSIDQRRIVGKRSGAVTNP